MVRLRCLQAWWATVARHLRAPPQRDCCQQESNRSQNFLLSLRRLFCCLLLLSLPHLLSEFPVCHFPFHLSGAHLVRHLSSHPCSCLCVRSVCRVAPCVTPPPDGCFLFCWLSLFFPLNSASPTPPPLQLLSCVFCLFGLKPSTLQTCPSISIFSTIQFGSSLFFVSLWPRTTSLPIN